MDSQSFIGIDPDDTRTARVNGASFTVGVIEQGIWERLRNEATLTYEAARRRAIRRMAEAGERPDEVVVPADPSKGLKSDLTALDVAAPSDPLYRERIHQLMCEAARWAVRGHEGFAKRDGSPVPFVTASETYEGCPRTVVGAETMRWYRANPLVVQSVWLELQKLQSLGEHEKKVSPPSSSETGSPSPATAAQPSPASSP